MMAICQEIGSGDQSGTDDPSKRPGLMVDEMLMRLGRWLRMAGMDVANASGGDRELLRKAKDEARTLITRDKELYRACLHKGISAILLRETGLEGQLRELAFAGIALRYQPVRCTVCNSSLQQVEKDQSGIPRTANGPFWMCSGCGKVFWNGSHVERISLFLERIGRNQ